MKVNVTQPITDLDGKPLSEDATLRRTCLQVLMNALDGDEKMPGDEKAKLFALGLKIHDEDEPDLTVDEWAKIKNRIGRGYGPAIVGRAYAMIEAGVKAD